MPKDFILYALFGGHFFVGTFVSYIPFLIKLWIVPCRNNKFGNKTSLLPNLCEE